jgi:2-polyprenyl-3-methyl-5-hydroxy-6-metoxy-1,4-benzoquinol methylase
LEYETLQLHLERYQFATPYIQRKRVLDIACGVGYGSKILVELGADSVTGVDISLEAIQYAKQHYAHSKIEYHIQDAMTFEDTKPYDVIISLETIEHLSDPHAFINRLPTLLKPNGILIGSVPITCSSDFNPYHLYDFTESEFLKTIENSNMKIIEKKLQIQPIKLFKLLRNKSPRTYNWRDNMLHFYYNKSDLLFRRIYETIRYGFNNRYLIIVAEKQ